MKRETLFLFNLWWNCVRGSGEEKGSSWSFGEEESLYSCVECFAGLMDPIVSGQKVFHW